MDEIREIPPLTKQQALSRDKLPLSTVYHARQSPGPGAAFAVCKACFNEARMIMNTFFQSRIYCPCLGTCVCPFRNTHSHYHSCAPDLCPAMVCLMYGRNLCRAKALFTGSMISLASFSTANSSMFPAVLPPPTLLAPALILAPVLKSTKNGASKKSGPLKTLNSYVLCGGMRARAMLCRQKMVTFLACTAYPMPEVNKPSIPALGLVNQSSTCIMVSSSFSSTVINC